MGVLFDAVIKGSAMSSLFLTDMLKPCMARYDFNELFPKDINHRMFLMPS